MGKVSNSGKWKTYGLWVASGLLTLMFGMSGVMKLMGVEQTTQMFSQWGYPLWFMYLIGAVEVLGAVGLLLPRFVQYAAFGLIGIMFGAVATHLMHADYLMALAPATLIGLLIVVGLGRCAPRVCSWKAEPDAT